MRALLAIILIVLAAFPTKAGGPTPYLLDRQCGPIGPDALACIAKELEATDRALDRKWTEALAGLAFPGWTPEQEAAARELLASSHAQWQRYREVECNQMLRGIDNNRDALGALCRYAIALVRFEAIDNLVSAPPAGPCIVRYCEPDIAEATATLAKLRASEDSVWRQVLDDIAALGNAPPYAARDLWRAYTADECGAYRAGPGGGSEARALRCEKRHRVARLDLLGRWMNEALSPGLSAPCAVDGGGTDLAGRCVPLDEAALADRCRPGKSGMGCLRRVYAAADAELRETFAVLLQALEPLGNEPDAEEAYLAGVIAGQEAWRRFREVDCIYDTRSSGDQADRAVVECLGRLTIQRIRTLRERYPAVFAE